MSSEEMGLVPDQRIENGLNSPLVFQDDALRFNCGAPQRQVGDPVPKSKELGAFIDEKMFAMERDRFFPPQGAELRRHIYGDCSDRRDLPDTRNWNGNGNTATPSGDESDGDDDEDADDDDDVEGDAEVEDLVGVNDSNKGSSNAINDVNHNNSGSNLATVADRMPNGKAQHHSTYGMNE